MDFDLSMEQEILRISVRQFAEKEIKPVAKELDEKEEFSYDTMRKMGELGLGPDGQPVHVLFRAVQR